MADDDACVGGDGGPLVVLQATAIPQWQGARNFENSLMNGGNVETDYDIICNGQGTEGICVVNRYGRDLLALWDCEFGATLLPPHLLLLPPDALVFTQCYPQDDLPDILPQILEHIQQREPRQSLLFNVQDTMLRLQVGADGSEPSAVYGNLDIPVAPGIKRCDVYLVESDSLHDEVVIINADSQNDV
jgi:RNAse (barnase) inhibitor barstar